MTSHGFDLDRLARLDSVMHGYVDGGRLPGVQTVITRRGDLVHRDCYGFADIEADRKVQPDTIYRLYSMTKPITSVALMMLYEEGQFLLGNPVSRFLPEFSDMQVWAGGTADDPQTHPAAERLTIKHLLTHTSGLTNAFGYRHPVDEMYRRAGLPNFDRPDYDLAELSRRAAELPLLFEPGTAWNYSISTDICGRLVEVMSGQSLEDFFRGRILEPLGMHETGFSTSEDNLDRCAAIYGRDRDKKLELWARATNLTKPPTMLSGGGGLVGTTDDYLRFCQFLLNRGELDGVRLLGTRTVDYMGRNHLPDNQLLSRMRIADGGETGNDGSGFGLGLAVVEDPAEYGVLCSAGEVSWGGAASTRFFVDPVEEICCVFMTQLWPSATYPLDQHLRAGVYQALID